LRGVLPPVAMRAFFRKGRELARRRLNMKAHQEVVAAVGHIGKAAIQRKARWSQAVFGPFAGVRAKLHLLDCVQAAIRSRSTQVQRATSSIR